MGIGALASDEEEGKRRRHPPLSRSHEETPLRLVGRRTVPLKRITIPSLPLPLAPPALTPPTQISRAIMGGGPCQKLLRHASPSAACPSIKEALSSLGLVGSSEDGTYPALQVTKVTTRKALIDVTLDYDYGGPNPRHDPRKGKPGRGL
ncbi:hypothetical protein OPV22_014168 [Ensete ventricosum]|uniref:Uncharacterized protein n=1 Tax=Ensete ventricosum TaxID=4639 RepID=A0AAV8RAX4_ENSVE|nr:hypothetical protein OPV22_014168 [Ensete ventricosum]